MRLTDCDFLDYLENCKHGSVINSSYEIKPYAGIIFSLTFEKDTEILRALEEFRQKKIFENNLGHDYPFMIEEYMGQLHLQYIYGNPIVAKHWDKKKEINKLKTTLTFRQKKISIIKPQIISSCVEKNAPKCFTDCQEKMQGHSYLELLNSEKFLTAQNEKEITK